MSKLEEITRILYKISILNNESFEDILKRAIELDIFKT